MEAKNQIILDAERVKTAGGRAAAIVAENNGDGIRMTYLYDINGELISKEYFLLPHETIDSISAIFIGAKNMERECADLMGIEIAGSPKGLLLTEESPPEPLRRLV